MSINTRIHVDVRTALRQDPRIKHPELIAVSVDEIGTVVLRVRSRAFLSVSPRRTTPDTSSVYLTGGEPAAARGDR
jgi:hypothetical protein